MKPSKATTMILLLILVIGFMTACYERGPVAENPPQTRREAVKDVLHGVEIMDYYRWLEDQESPETRAWIDSQNEYSHSVLSDSPRRRAFEKRLTELMAVDQVGRPYQRNNQFFVWNKQADDDLCILYKRNGLDGEDRVLIDPHPLSDDHTTSVTLEDISEDGVWIAYGIRSGGADEVEIRIRNVETGEDLPDRLPWGLYNSFDFGNDNTGFYYAARDRDTGTRVRYHTIGGEFEDDVDIFGEGFDPDLWIAAWLSGTGRYLLFYVAHGWASSDLFFKDVSKDGPVTTLTEGLPVSFEPAFAGDRLVVQTDWKAQNRRLLAVDLTRPDPDDWKEIVPEGEDSIEDFSLVGGRIFVHYLRNVTSRVEVYDLEGKKMNDLPLPGTGSASAPRGRWDSDTAFFGFESFTTPWSIYQYDIPMEHSEVWGQQLVPFDPATFEVSQVWYTSRDGTRVPMFLVHKQGLELDGSNPTLLYGYGGFNASITPRFRSMWAVWVENGGVFALANIRGGGEFGEAWHRAGMLENKQNVFDDFIAAAEWLINNNYTKPVKLAIQGGSNGGLLVGASITQRPELYRAALCQFPDLDMVRYYQFENNNPPALAEYGDASDPEQFKYLYAYSPYQKIKSGTKYPAVLLTTGDADTRVPPLQARKMTAALQHATTSGYPVMLLYDTKAGHAGGVPFKKRVHDLSLELLFLSSQLGVNGP